MRKLLPYLMILFCNVIFSQEVQVPLKVGDEEVVNFTSNDAYSENYAGIVYSKEFRNIGSSYIKVYLENFDLNNNDYLRIYGANNGEEYFYSGSGKTIGTNNTINDFWSITIWDEHIILELHSENGNNNHYGFDITKVAYGYPINKITGAFQTSAQIQETVCGGDEREAAACYDGTEIGRKSDAICRLLIGGTSLCTGWLLGDEGHVMTNNHCISNTNEALNTEFWFNFRTSDCSGLNNDATDIVATSSTFIQTSSGLDFTLVQLPVNPTDTYGYLSLASIPPSVGERIYHPQHPGGRRNEIAVTTDTNPGPNGYTVISDAGGPGNRVEYFHDTEGGSSGSPIIRYDDHLVVAIHNTGGCPNGAFGRSDQLISAIGPNMPNGGIDDPNPDSPRISFGSSPDTTMEGTGCDYQDVTFNLRIALPPSENADVTVSFTGSATEGSDFEMLSSNPITFNQGSEDNQQIVIRVFNDGFIESQEDIILNLALNNNGGDATLASSNTFSHIIMDNDITPNNANESELFSDSFEIDLNDWTVSGNGTSNFAIGDSAASSSSNWSTNGNSTNFIFVNDDACDCDMSEERIQLNNPVDLSQVNSAQLSFDIKYFDSNDQYGSDAFVQTSIDNGATWQNLSGELPSYSNWESVSYDLSGLIGESSVLISFLYDDLGNWSYGMALDNIRIAAQNQSDIHTTVNTGIEAINHFVNDEGTMHVFVPQRLKNNIMTTVTTASDAQFGCVSFATSRVGTGGQSFNGSTGGDLAMDKEFTIGVANDVNSTTEITFYFTEEEVAGWENAVSIAGGSHTRSNLFIYRDSSRGLEVVPAELGTFNGGVTLKGTFSSLEGIFNFAPENLLNARSFDVSNVRIFPNPTQDIVTINSDIVIDTIEIFDISGKLIDTIYNPSLNKSNTLDIKNLTTGLYFIKVKETRNYNIEKTYKVYKK